MHGPHRLPLLGGDAAHVHQAGGIRRAEDVGSRRHHGRDLVLAHRRRGLGVLDCEGAAETAALLRAWERPQLQTLDRLQKTVRSVADPEQAQGMAGGVIGNAVFEGGADVGDA